MFPIPSSTIKTKWITHIDSDPSHSHSVREEDNEKYKVVVCDDNIHMAVSFLACCPSKSEEYSVGFFARNLGMDVEIVEIWDQADIRMGEPGKSLYCHDAKVDVKVGVK